MAIKVHGLAKTACTARVLACLHEKGLEFELVPIDFLANAHKQQPYLSLNPFGQVPALEDGEFTLFESRAINRYIAHKYDDVGTDLLRLNSLRESTIVDMWVEVEAQQFSGPITELVRQMIINSHFKRLAPDEKVIEAESKKLAKVLDVYEERLSNCKYLAGDYFTMADLNHLPYLFLFMRTQKASLVTSRPNVCAWWNDISSRPTSIKVMEGLKY